MDEVRMPQLGETVTEGTITRWWKQPGDTVALDEVLFEVSTDKVDTEVPSAHAGVLRRILVAEGETAPVGALLAVLTATADEPLPDAPPPEASRAASGPQAAVAPPTGSSGHRGGGPTSPPPPSSRRDPDAGRDASGFLSPVVRRLLDEHGLRADEVIGSGSGGRVTRADVLAAAANRRRPPAPAAGADRAPAPPVVAGPDDDVVGFTRARALTAQAMTRSLATSAHTLVGTAVDYGGLEEVRRGAGLSYLPFVARAVVDALGEFPRLNASVGDGELVVHRRVHLGVAVDVGFEALVVPVVHDAAGLRLRALSDAVADLAARARAKRLGADDLAGGTFTITNVGQYGTVVTFPIIQQPQVAILSTDGVRMTPVARRGADGGWAVVVRPVGNLSLAFDHRAVDGAEAAAFLARVRTVLETRDWAAEVA